jgi:hypothetical protein
MKKKAPPISTVISNPAPRKKVKFADETEPSLPPMLGGSPTQPPQEEPITQVVINEPKQQKSEKSGATAPLKSRPPPPPSDINTLSLSSSQSSSVSPTVIQDTTLLTKEKVAEEIVPLLRRFFSRDHLELELKLGRWRKGRFISGVEKVDFMRIHDMLYGFKNWSNSTTTNPSVVAGALGTTAGVDSTGANATSAVVGANATSVNSALDHWVSSFDYMLENQIRCSKTASGSKFVRKSLVENLTYQCRDRHYDFRVSLKEEVPVELRLPGDPHLIRIKKRKSFIYKNKFSFDLTIVWSGQNENEAQQNDPTYEIEIECISKKEIGHDHYYTASSLMEKIIDFLGRDTPLHFIRERGVPPL